MASKAELEEHLRFISESVNVESLSLSIGPIGQWQVVRLDGDSYVPMMDIGATKGEAEKTLLRLSQWVRSTRKVD